LEWSFKSGGKPLEHRLITGLDQGRRACQPRSVPGYSCLTAKSEFKCPGVGRCETHLQRDRDAAVQEDGEQKRERPIGQWVDRCRRYRENWRAGNQRQPRSGKPTHPARGRQPRTRGHGKPTCRRRTLPPRGETEVRQPSRNSNGGRESRQSTSRPTRLRKGRPSWAPRRQQAWSLVMGRRLEGVGPTYPTPPEPEHQQARRAGVVQPAAADACDAS
jgi:hypothetical protein